MKCARYEQKMLSLCLHSTALNSVFLSLLSLSLSLSLVSLYLHPLSFLPSFLPLPPSITSFIHPPFIPYPGPSN